LGPWNENKRCLPRHVDQVATTQLQRRTRVPKRSEASNDCMLDEKQRVVGAQDESCGWLVRRTPGCASRDGRRANDDGNQSNNETNPSHITSLERCSCSASRAKQIVTSRGKAVRYASADSLRHAR
jgi:hypothetical protein